MSGWTVIEPKDQERIWGVALAIMSRREISLAEALQIAAAEFYAADRSLKRGIKFYVMEDGEQALKRIRELENGTWVNERARASTKEV